MSDSNPETDGASVKRYAIAALVCGGIVLLLIINGVAEPPPDPNPLPFPIPVSPPIWDNVNRGLEAATDAGADVAEAGKQMTQQILPGGSPLPQTAPQPPGPQHGSGTNVPGTTPSTQPSGSGSPSTKAQ